MPLSLQKGAQPQKSEQFYLHQLKMSNALLKHRISYDLKTCFEDLEDYGILDLLKKVVVT